MVIHVTTPPTFRRPDLQNKEIRVAGGTTLKQFMADAKLQDSCVAYVLVNKKKAGPDRELRDGDAVSFIPMMAGG